MDNLQPISDMLDPYARLKDAEDVIISLCEQARDNENLPRGQLVYLKFLIQRTMLLLEVDKKLAECESELCPTTSN